MGDHTIISENSVSVEALGGIATTTNISLGALRPFHETAANAYGLYANSIGNHELSNSSALTVIARAGEIRGLDPVTHYASGDGHARAYAMYANGDGSHILNNSGTINVEATAANVLNYGVVNTFAHAYGMAAYGSGNHQFTNEGDITVSATSTYDNAYAYGMHILFAQGAGAVDVHHISSTGSISASASAPNGDAYAYEAFSIGSLVVDTWATTLRTWSENDTVFGVIQGNTVTFGDGTNGATLVVRPELDANGNAIFGKEYELANMVAISGSRFPQPQAMDLQSTITGSIASVETETNLIVAEFDNTTPSQPSVILRNVVGSSTELPSQEGASQTVNTAVESATGIGTLVQRSVVVGSSINLTPTPTGGASNAGGAGSTGGAGNTGGAGETGNTGGVGNTGGADGVGNAGGAGNTGNTGGAGNTGGTGDSGSQSEDEEQASIEPRGIAAGSGNMQSPWSVFMNIYGSYTDNDKYNFNTSTFGATAGANYHFSSPFTLGFHADFNYAKSSSASNIDNEATTFAFGGHANYFIGDNWYVGAQATASFANNDIDYALSSVLRDSDEYSTFSLYSALNVGYVYEINESNVLIPEISLSYLHTSVDDYRFDFGVSAYNMHVHNTNYNALYLSGKLTWQGAYALESSTLIPSLSVGIRQNLTGGDIRTNIGIFGGTSETIATEDETTFTATAGLQWTSGNFSLGAYYDGAFGSNQQSHSGSLRATYRF